MTLLDFARGPALEASLIIFVAGTLWRFLGVLLLPWRLVAAEPRARRASGVRVRSEGHRRQTVAL